MSVVKYLVLWVLCLSGCSLMATDTLSVTLQQADSLFFAKNYYLLAASLNVEAQQAQVLQARLYPNPVFVADVNAYDPGNKQVFHVGPSGQKVFALEQLIILGGKRKSEIELAKTDSRIAELEFQNLVRQLKFRLHSDLFAIGQQQVLLSKYSRQLALLDTILANYQVQADRGNVPLKDIVRLKGAYLEVNNTRAELYKEYYEAQAHVQTLLQTSSRIKFEFSEEEVTDYIKEMSWSELAEKALANRPDLLIGREEVLGAEQFLRYQKQMAVPDLNLFVSYDQRGGAFNNQINLGVSLPLPLWNRNQGNIQSSELRMKEAEYLLEVRKTEVLSNLQNAFALYQQTVSEYQRLAGMYNLDFENTLIGFTDNLKKGNVSILEFVDFFESYSEVLTELARIKTQLVLSGEQLNLLIGQDIY